MGELAEALDAIKWGTDYLLNCHTEPKKFVAMYGQSEVRSDLLILVSLGFACYSRSDMPFVTKAALRLKRGSVMGSN